MRHPSFWLALLIAAFSPAGRLAAAPGAVDASFSQAHAQLQSQHLALTQASGRLQTGDPSLRAQLGKILSELPDQVQSYGAAQSRLGVDDGPLVRQIGAEAHEAAALAPQDALYPAKVAKVRDDLAQLLLNSARRYPQLGGAASRGPGGAPERSAEPQAFAARPAAAPNAAVARLLHCADAGFDGARGCAGSSPAGGGGRSASASDAGAANSGGAGQPQITTSASGLLSGGRARLDQATSGIDRFDGGRTPASAGDDLMPPADRQLSGQLKRILAADGKAANARDYLARYAALAASRKRDPGAVAAWETEVKPYIQFKGGGGVMRGVQKGLAAAASPANALGGRPDTAVSEACWQALAKEHPQFAQGCADNPRTAAMMAGAYQALADQVKGLASPMSIAIMLGTLLVSGLASGGVADVIALLLAVGFTAWMVWKIIRDYGPKLVSALRGLINSKSGSAESFVKWKESAYYFTTTLVAVAGIYLGANGISKLTGKLSSITGREVAAAGASSDAAVVAGKVEPIKTPAGTAAAGGEAVQATDALMAKAAAAEPRITVELQRVTEQNGGELVGLKNRLKGAKSLTEKIAKDMKDKGMSADEAAGKIGDTVRYTSILPEESFTRGVDATLDGLKTKGYKIVKYKNTFQDGNVYKGINCQLRSPEGHLFELQFHTVESFELKSAMHGEYEIARDPGKALAVRQAAFDRMKVAARGIKPPPGVDTLGEIQPLPTRP
ncbi:MAG TPA: hypothetical protein VN915_13345 [Elusimicrobiota bacterium]|nr:hypothetical protein [Elusimicrobiota bacterium]